MYTCIYNNIATRDLRLCPLHEVSTDSISVSRSGSRRQVRGSLASVPVKLPLSSATACNRRGSQGPKAFELPRDPLHLGAGLTYSIVCCSGRPGHTRVTVAVSIQPSGEAHSLHIPVGIQILMSTRLGKSLNEYHLMSSTQA